MGNIYGRISLSNIEKVKLQKVQGTERTGYCHGREWYLSLRRYTQSQSREHTFPSHGSLPHSLKLESGPGERKQSFFFGGRGTHMQHEIGKLEVEGAESRETVNTDAEGKSR